MASGRSDGGPWGTGVGAGGPGRGTLLLQPVPKKALLKGSAANHLMSSQGTATSAGHTSWGCCRACPPKAGSPAPGAERGAAPRRQPTPPRARLPIGWGPCPAEGPPPLFLGPCPPSPPLYPVPFLFPPFLFPPVAAAHGVVYCDVNLGKSLLFPAELCKKARSLEIGGCTPLPPGDSHVQTATQTVRDDAEAGHR